MYEYAIVFLFTLYVTAFITRRLLTEVVPKVSAVVPEVPAVVPEVPAVLPKELKCTEYTDIPAVLPEVPAVLPEVSAVLPKVPKIPEEPKVPEAPKALTAPKAIPKEIQYVLPSVSLQKHEEYVRLKMQWELMIKN